MSSAAPTPHASTDDLIRWRMRSLGLRHPLPGTEQERVQDRLHAVADRMLAVQGQDWNAARWAFGVRAPGTTEADVVAAFDSGALVRSWPMRGTIHLLAAGDLGWMQALTNHRVLPGAAKRRQFLGLDDDTLARMTDIATERLSGGRSLSRDELGRAWSEAGIGDPEKGLGPWRYHVIWWLCQNGIAVAGPVNAAPGTEAGAAAADPEAGAGTGVETGSIPEPRLVLAEEWIDAPRRIDGDEALAELAARFSLGRGPVQDRDLAWWTGLTMRDARRGIAAAEEEGRLAPVEVDGTRYVADPALLDATGAAGALGAAAGSSPGAGQPDADDVMLLPGFDEHLLGYADRSAVLDPEHFERIVPGRNGMFRATVVQGGRVVGVWMRTPRAGRVRIEVEPFPGEAIDLGRLRAPAETWGAFRGVDIELAVG